MSKARPEVLDFLLTRRSRPVKLLSAPAPDRAEVTRLLTAAARAPDHGKLEPWRFIVLEGAGLARFAKAVRARAAETGADADKGASAFETAPMAIAVVATPKDDSKAPPVEQTLSAGAVCLGLLNAALASGWGANWLTGWPAYDEALLAGTLGLAPGEWIAGFIYIGSCDKAPPERPRPDVPALISWVDA